MLFGLLWTRRLYGLHPSAGTNPLPPSPVVTATPAFPPGFADQVLLGSPPDPAYLPVEETPGFPFIHQKCYISFNEFQRN